MDDAFQRMRVEYRNLPLDRGQLDSDPFVQFRRWMTEAERAGIEEPNAFVLATADTAGRPSARTVLLKGLGAGGFDFFTNYQSRKAAEMAANPEVEAVFLWIPIRRQVRIEGKVSKVEPGISDAYFASRPPESRLASAASPQSQVVASRDELDARLEELRRRYPDGNVPRPPHWGGYRIEPRSFEFWQGREARFHDRFRYRRDGRQWTIERLAP